MGPVPHFAELPQQLGFALQRKLAFGRRMRF